MQSPEIYLHQFPQIEFPCPVNPDRKAVVDEKMRAFVNYEVYFFSDRGALRRFRKDPLRYCGLLTDPVTQRRFHPAKSSPHLEYKDRLFYFSSDSTRVAFVATPDSFAMRKGM